MHNPNSKSKFISRGRTIDPNGLNIREETYFSLFPVSSVILAVTLFVFEFKLVATAIFYGIFPVLRPPGSGFLKLHHRRPKLSVSMADKKYKDLCGTPDKNLKTTII